MGSRGADGVGEGTGGSGEDACGSGEDAYGADEGPGGSNEAADGARSGSGDSGSGSERRGVLTVFSGEEIKGRGSKSELRDGLGSRIGQGIGVGMWAEEEFTGLDSTDAKGKVVS